MPNTDTTPPPRTLVGAYALAPSDPGAESRLYAGLAELPVGGLEMPVLEDSPALTPAWRRSHLEPHWDLLLTCIPTVMGRLGQDPAYGLAARDDDARDRALTDVARARDLALAVADEQGRPAVLGIQVHSAPRPEHASADALARSLETILGWDLAGARLLLEHCDAAVSGRTAAKGFMDLDEEVAVLRGLGAGAGTTPDGPEPAVGLSINWGRSAIEGRSARTPLTHLEAARSAGMLGALVLSGATDTETAWGPAWSDAHIPPAGIDPALTPSQASLLGPAEVGHAVAAAGDAPVAVKVSVRPRDVDVDTRLAVVRACLDLVRAAQP